jgi:membrane-associated phospholipid phosphatase
MEPLWVFPSAGVSSYDVFKTNRGEPVRTFLIGTSCVLGLLFCQPAFARDTKAWGTASSVGRDALVVAALGVPAVQGDWTGDLEAAGSMGAAFGIAEGLKEAFPERRPDGSDDKSFPSGHASVSFAAAASLQNRYGWKVGLPAQLVATFVALGRVEARKHHWYDVVAGAAIGEGSGFLITGKRNGGVRILPWGDTSGGGASLAVRF